MFSWDSKKTTSSYRLLSCVLGEVSHVEQPLELSDIMPLASKTYDKMRPPKYKGKPNFFLQMRKQ